METSYLKTLELDKIIARAAEGCVCKEAKAKLLALEPQCDPDEVRYALEQTDAINTLLIKNGSPRFGGVEGVSALAARAVKGGVLSMGELLMVAGALRNFQNLTNWYGSSEHDMLPTDDLFYALSPEPGLEQQISSAILAPDAMADTASRTLNDLRKKIRATENSIRDRLESMVRNMDTSKYLQESVVSMRNGRYVVPVKSEYRGEVSGIIHDVSSTGATVFVEPQAVVEANARILQYRAQEAQEIERILEDSDEPVTFTLGDKHILFSIGDALLVSRVLEGEFIDWRRVVPTNCGTVLTANVAELTSSIERVSLIISEKVKSPVRCVFGDNMADFRTANTIGSAHDTCSIAGNGGELEIGFNSRYLLEALRVIPSEEVTLELQNGLSPIVFTPCDKKYDFAYMVLPVRLRSNS